MCCTPSLCCHLLDALEKFPGKNTAAALCPTHFCLISLRVGEGSGKRTSCVLCLDLNPKQDVPLKDDDCFSEFIFQNRQKRTGKKVSNTDCMSYLFTKLIDWKKKPVASSDL